MTDYFVLFDLPRLPWIEPQVLKERFLALSAKTHPDRHHAEISELRFEADNRFKEINSAYACLRDPISRIRHFIVLEAGGPPQEIQEIPHSTTSLFMEVGQLCAGVDRHLKNQESVTSPLIRVERFAQNMAWVEKTHAMQRKLEEWRNELHRSVKDLSDGWVQDSAGNRLHALTGLERYYRLLSYESRWSTQLQDRLSRLHNLV